MQQRKISFSEGYYKRKEKEAEKIGLILQRKKLKNKKRLIRRKIDCPDIRFSKMEVENVVQEIFPYLYLFHLYFVVLYLHRSLQVKKDSTTIYKDIESFSKQSKFKTFIYSLVFKPAQAPKKKRLKKKGIKN